MESPLVTHTLVRLRNQLAALRDSGGGRLPREVDMAAELGVSRPILRQALQVLKAEGVIESRRGSGTFLTETAAPEPGATVYRRPESLRDIEDCLRFRIVVESAAAEAAAERADLAAVNAIEAAIAAQAAGPAAHDTVAEADFFFHLAVARAGGNRYFPMTLEFLRPHILLGLRLGRQLRSTPANVTSRRVAAEHGEILTAIAAGDGSLARERMSAHLTAGVERLFGTRGW